jgi:hypothetical protein
VLILLPPSETKRDGGAAGSRLDIGSLRFARLAAVRRRVLRAVTSLAKDEAATIAALRLGPRQHGEVLRNRAIKSTPIMPAIDRYTGVLYDALDAASLTDAARSFAHEHLVVHSALFGPVAALDEIPAYRLSWDSRLPGLPLTATWGRPVSGELSRERGLILDLRSDGYTKLGPLPERSDTATVRVVSPSSGASGDGRRPLNHFNKRSKGLFARALLASAAVLPDVPTLLDWAGDAGFDLQNTGPGQLELLARAPVSSPS